LSLTTLTSFRDPWTAHIFCGRLQSEGVPFFIAYEFHIGNNWPLSTALGWVKVQVPLEQLADARKVVERARSGEFHALLEGEVGDIDDPHCPNCGAADYWCRRPHLHVIIAILCTFFLVLVPAWGRVCFCNRCGAKFRP
jgi:hypothetical protein